MEWYTIRNIDDLDTPSLVLYPPRIEGNISLALKFVSDSRRLRPHIKTSKCPEVVRMMLADGITRFKCATIAEAEMLAQQGAEDVLLAYQPVGPKGQRFCQLQARFPDTVFSCLIDNRNTLLELSTRAVDAGLMIRVLIDLNTGMNRTGMAPGQEALELYLEAARTPGVRMVGLHSYDGHLRDADLALRQEKCDAAFAHVTEMRLKIRSMTGIDPLVVAGGSPTFPIHARRTDVECSPGTFVFWDKGYQQALREQPFEFAALVVSRIISQPDKTTLCCDLGHKAIASENPLPRRVDFLNAPDLEPIGHSEEHLVLRAQENHPYRTGDVLYGVPYHICPTVALYDEAATCRDNRLGDRWQILARKRKLTV